MSSLTGKTIASVVEYEPCGCSARASRRDDANESAALVSAMDHKHDHRANP